MNNPSRNYKKELRKFSRKIYRDAIRGNLEGLQELSAERGYNHLLSEPIDYGVAKGHMLAVRGSGYLAVFEYKDEKEVVRGRDSTFLAADIRDVLIATGKNDDSLHKAAAVLIPYLMKQFIEYTPPINIAFGVFSFANRVKVRHKLKERGGEFGREAVDSLVFEDGFLKDLSS